MVVGAAEEAEAVGQDLQDALGEDEPLLLGLGSQDLEDQLLLLHGRGAGDVEPLGHPEIQDLEVVLAAAGFDPGAP